VLLGGNIVWIASLRSQRRERSPFQQPANAQKTGNPGWPLTPRKRWRTDCTGKIPIIGLVVFAARGLLEPAHKVTTSLESFMSMMTRRRLIGTAAAAGTLITAPSILHAQATRAKMILNWRYQGPQSWFFQAQDMGFLKEEGVELEIDQGEGSAAAITKVATGAYDIGFGDMNALIDLASKKPEDAPIACYAMFNNPPFTIAVKADGSIKTVKDLEGKTIGGPANDAALKLFPAFAKLAGIDASKVTITNMAPNLRETMLQRGQVDAVFGFVNTIAFSARLAGIDPDREFRFINYVDYKMDLYSNTLVVSKKLAKDNPKAVSGIVRAFNRGLAETLKNLDAAVDSVAKREPLIKKDIEKARLIATLKAEMSHPEVARIGIGDVDDERFRRGIAIVTEANQLPRVPGMDEVFTRAFLPPAAERIKLLGV
jgi:NitT/TauT family transport system substrate-binding protein